jgi:hypothetical protein
VTAHGCGVLGGRAARRSLWGSVRELWRWFAWQGIQRKGGCAHRPRQVYGPALGWPARVGVGVVGAGVGQVVGVRA